MSLPSLFRKKLPLETKLKDTKSKCPICEKIVPAEVIKISTTRKDEKVVMRRTCPEHGMHEFVISSDARFYWLAKGNPANSDCGCGSACSSSKEGKNGYLGKNALSPANDGVVEKLSTCLALIEIVDSCNLACPTCFANSPIGIGLKVKHRSFEKITDHIQGVIDRKGPIEIIQFSGGEPTIHPQFFELVEWVVAHPDIECLLINTNGVRLSKDQDFVQRLGQILQSTSVNKIQLYLQFDGPQAQGQRELRGADLRQVREVAIRNCESIGLPITLAMTVNRQNLMHLWDAVMFALPFSNIRGISFQPMFLSGRVLDAVTMMDQPINTADIILGLHEQSKTKISLDDFTPLPCGDPNCATIGWLFRVGGKYHSPSKYGVKIAQLQGKLKDRINYRLEDLQQCGCDNTVLGNIMRRLENPVAGAFRLFIKPFMDPRSWDADRIDRCCTHVIDPKTGKLRSFCEYYANQPSTA